MNATRAATIRLRSSFDGAVSLGRVQTPTLAILARREEEIRAFEPEPYWLVDATFAADDDRVYEGRYHDGSKPRLHQRGRGRGDRRGRPRPRGRDHQARDVPPEGARPASLRPHVAAARGQHALRLLRAPHAGRGAAPVRGAHGAHVPAHELALPAVGHARRDQADRRAPRPPGAPTRRPRATSPGSTCCRSRGVINDEKVTDHHAIIPTRAEHDVSTVQRRRPADLRHRRAALPRRLPPGRRVREHARRDDGGGAHLPHARPRAARARAGAASTARPPRATSAPRATPRTTRAATSSCPSSSRARPWRPARSRRWRRRPSRRGATATPRCWPRWRPPASSSTTTSCARR